VSVVTSGQARWGDFQLPLLCCSYCIPHPHPPPPPPRLCCHLRCHLIQLPLLPCPAVLPCAVLLCCCPALQAGMLEQKLQQKVAENMGLFNQLYQVGSAARGRGCTRDVTLAHEDALHALTARGRCGLLTRCGRWLVFSLAAEGLWRGSSQLRRTWWKGRRQ